MSPDELNRRRDAAVTTALARRHPGHNAELPAHIWKPKLQTDIAEFESLFLAKGEATDL